MKNIDIIKDPKFKPALMSIFETEEPIWILGTQNNYLNDYYENLGSDNKDFLNILSNTVFFLHTVENIYGLYFSPKENDYKGIVILDTEGCLYIQGDTFLNFFERSNEYNGGLRTTDEALNYYEKLCKKDYGVSNEKFDAELYPDEEEMIEEYAKYFKG